MSVKLIPSGFFHRHRLMLSIKDLLSHSEPTLLILSVCSDKVLNLGSTSCDLYVGKVGAVSLKYKICLILISRWGSPDGCGGKIINTYSK